MELKLNQPNKSQKGWVVIAPLIDLAMRGSHRKGRGPKCSAAELYEEVFDILAPPSDKPQQSAYTPQEKFAFLETAVWEFRRKGNTRSLTEIYNDIYYALSSEERPAEYVISKIPSEIHKKLLPSWLKKLIVKFCPCKKSKDNGSKGENNV